MSRWSRRSKPSPARGLDACRVVDENDKLVGMITNGDITRGVLIAIRRGLQGGGDPSLPRQSSLSGHRLGPHQPDPALQDQAGDFVNGGQASSHIKRALLRLGAPPQLARQCGIAVYEAEINLIIHSTNGGVLRVQVEPHRILMQTSDDGPGIPDVKQALTPGWSTASPLARSMGFGAGMGLVNIRRCVDKMDLDPQLARAPNC
ncbi:MAG: ATP-binding protein [Ignavibacteriales bacterium]|nr:ATP-binding protein [Ignavibacteriales bacterium]